MTKGIHQGFGVIQRLILSKLAAGQMDTVTLTARVYGVDPAPDAAGRWNMTEAQYSAVRRALKTLQRAGKVGISGHQQRRTLWLTMERLAKLMAYDPTCEICQTKLRDQDLVYALKDGEVHGQCLDGQPNPEYPQRAYCYENEYRKLNGISNARAKENPSGVGPLNAAVSANSHR
jgi:hypothetical protein